MLLLAALGVAIWLQRATVADALSEIQRLSLLAIAALLVLSAYERWSRANIVRRLLGEPIGIGSAVVIHDVGNAVSKGVPLGGALGTALRWSICRESGVTAPRFASMLIAYGVATTFASWILPLLALLVDLTQRSPDRTDSLILVVIVVVVGGSAAFWTFALTSHRAASFATASTAWVWTRLGRRLPSLDGIDPAAGVAEVRSELIEIGRSPWGLMVRTLLAQACGSLILLTALRSLGVGDELGLTEFFRVFFITHLLGTFAPTPGGVGVVEAGLTGALMAAGVETTTALAGVLVYRLLTYVLPIVVGAILTLGWRAGWIRCGARRAATL